MTSRQRLNAAIGQLQRFANSRKLDNLHVERSGVRLNLAAVGVLERVIEHGPLGLSELGKRTGMRPSALSRQVRLLEEEGHLARAVDAGDRRAAVVTATAKGGNAYRQWRKTNDRLLATQLQGWTDREIDDLAAQLERLVTDLRATIAP